MRQIVLDTETTGLEPEQGHRIIEIGAVELIDRKPTRRHFHRYVNPQREIDDGALAVHGITQAFLADKPAFSDIADEFLTFIAGAELIIHNAPFDVSFLDYEFARLSRPHRRIEEICSVVDTLALARHKHPGQKNSLDALCRRYGVDNSQRDLHGALLDAEILADVYLMMTGGQTALFVADETDTSAKSSETFVIVRIPADRPRLRVVVANAVELTRHAAMLDAIDERAHQGSLWRSLSIPQINHAG
jgi:DNA polymerase III subunit epsilon